MEEILHQLGYPMLSYHITVALQIPMVYLLLLRHMHTLAVVIPLPHKHLLSAVCFILKQCPLSIIKSSSTRRRQVDDKITCGGGCLKGVGCITLDMRQRKTLVAEA